MVLAVTLAAATVVVGGSTSAMAAPPAVPQIAAAPSLGAGVYVFDPSMPQEQIQQTVDAVAAQQVDAEFGSGRYALLFKPGSYGTPGDPLTFQVGYYTEVAGLGAQPGDVVINGTINVYNQCLTPDNCLALVNFWRSMSNLTINVAGGQGCRANTEFWAVSQAAPMRRVQVNGGSSLMDYCTAGPQYASGGFIADSSFSGSIVNGSQQQFLVRNSVLNGWSNGVWNQVFAGTVNAPATSFGVAGKDPYTTLEHTGLTAERPYLGLDAKGRWVVRVPDTRTRATGTDWADGHVDRALPLSSFFIATPRTSITAINIALALGRNLLLTPGRYNLRAPILVSRPNAVVLGLGFPTLTPQTGLAALSVLQPSGVRVAGLLIDAGPRESRTLLDVGLPGLSGRHSGAPTVLSDVFFRIGGPGLGKAKVSLQVNASDVVLDHIWAWRADHGTGVGWDQNTADNGVVVRGDRVSAYGLFVEHYQKTEVVWSGRDGSVVMFQNEMPYDPPNQAAWQESPTKPGYPALEVTKSGKDFDGWGMGSYSFFNHNVDIHASTAFRVPPRGVALHSLLTVFLNGSGAIDSVVNGLGGAAVVSGTPVQVISYPPLVLPAG